MKGPENKLFVGIIICIVAVGLLYFSKKIFSVPMHFPSGTTFTISENETLRSISYRLKDLGYIESPLLFRTGISYFGKDRSIQLGGYFFSAPMTLVDIVGIFVRGEPDTPLLSLTVPEGSTSLEIADLVSKVVPTITPSEFNSVVTKNKAEGKLFPSTYYLLPSYKADSVVKLMLTTFVKKAEPIITASKLPAPLVSEDSVLVLASILEGEAKTAEDMKIVSGILLRRLTNGMLLQVDVAKETYKKKGLPNVPINNPGLISIDAALNPTNTNYFFYITGNDGKMYYATTFEEHKRNIKKYLK